MRHNLLSGPIAAGARRMLQASATAGLIALSRRPLRLLSRFLCTSPGAVNLATVAVTADHDRKAAACAHKEPSRRGLRTVRCPTWTRAATSGIMPRHACSARCRGTASRRDLAVAGRRRAVSISATSHSSLQCARHAAFPSPTHGGLWICGQRKGVAHISTGQTAAASTFNLMNSKSVSQTCLRYLGIATPIKLMSCR
jgi:hypothetical protein